MNKKSITGFCLAALLLVMPGCTTTNGKKAVDPVTADTIAPILSGSVAGTVIYAYTRNPDTEIYIGVIRTALYEFLLSEDLSPMALQTKIYNLPIPALKTAEAQLLISPLIATYKGFVDQKVKAGVQDDPGLRTLIQAMVDGLDQGLVGISQIKSSSVSSSAIMTDHEALQAVFRALEQRIRDEIDG